MTVQRTKTATMQIEDRSSNIITELRLYYYQTVQFSIIGIDEDRK